MQGLPHKRGFLNHIRGAQIFLCLRQAVAQQVLLFHRRNVIRRPETIVHPVFQSGFQFSGQHLRRGANPRGRSGIQGCLAFWSQKKRPPKNIPSAITKKMTERMRPSAKPAFPPCLRAAGERNSFFSNKSLISKRKYPQKTIAERRSHTTGTPKAAQR